MEERIDTLLSLMSADLEVLKSLTPDERRVLVAAVTERVEKMAANRVDTLVSVHVDSLVKGWIESEARKAATVRWGATISTMTGLVDTAIAKYLTAEYTSSIVDTFAVPAVRDFVKETINKALTAARAVRSV